MPKETINRLGYKTTNEWITPKKYIDLLGGFDLDPCSSKYQKVKYAKINYEIKDDGLSKEWEGITWMNPPYDRTIKDWIEKFFNHSHGIALIPSRTGTRWFQDFVFKKGCVLFLKGRIKFHGYKDYNQMTGMHDSCFWAIGKTGEGRIEKALENNLLKGTLFKQWPS